MEISVFSFNTGNSAVSKKFQQTIEDNTFTELCKEFDFLCLQEVSAKGSQNMLQKKMGEKWEYLDFRNKKLAIFYKKKFFNPNNTTCSEFGRYMGVNFIHLETKISFTLVCAHMPYKKGKEKSWEKLQNYLKKLKYWVLAGDFNDKGKKIKSLKDVIKFEQGNSVSKATTKKGSNMDDILSNGEVKSFRIGNFLLSDKEHFPVYGNILFKKPGKKEKKRKKKNKVK